MWAWLCYIEGKAGIEAAGKIKDMIMNNKQKSISQIRETMDGYLCVEKDLQKILDNGGDGYGYEETVNTKSSQLSRELDLQYKHLEKQLKSFGYKNHPVELIEIYSTSRLMAIQILDGC